MQRMFAVVGASLLFGLGACAHVQDSSVTDPSAEIAVTQSTPEMAAEPVPPPPIAVYEHTEAVPAEQAETAQEQPAVAQAEGAAPAQGAAQGVAPQQEGAQNAGVDKSVAEKPSKGSQEASAKEAAPMAESGAISLARFVLAQSVEEREPVGEGTSFQAGSKIYAFVQAGNTGDEAQSLRVRWAQEGGEPTGGGEISVGVSPRWRSWMVRTAPANAGKYRCILETEDGEKLADIAFEVTE